MSGLHHQLLSTAWSNCTGTCTATTYGYDKGQGFCGLKTVLLLALSQKSVSDTLERQSSFADKRRFYFRCSAKVRLRYSCVSCQMAFRGAKDAPTTTTTYSYSLWTRVSGGRESYSDSSAWYQVQCKKALVFSVKKWSFNFEIFNFWWCIMN